MLTIVFYKNLVVIQYNSYIKTRLHAHNCLIFYMFNGVSLTTILYRRKFLLMSTPRSVPIILSKKYINIKHTFPPQLCLWLSPSRGPKVLTPCPSPRAAAQPATSPGMRRGVSRTQRHSPPTMPGPPTTTSQVRHLCFFVKRTSLSAMTSITYLKKKNMYF